ncbi:MAG: Zn-ribbon domain-containing OB-fold protein [Deltaproteobacteria bacterium]|nr:Zn-ribbon domain-containing OB-fold protein [Deltaproteobacteria bacterium]
MKHDLSEVEPLVINSQINVPYDWWAGETASRFFIDIRDDQKILGTRCEKCHKVFVPPRKTCPRCFCEQTSWVELPPEGELVTYTIAWRQLPALPKKAPVIFGLIKLDGADTALLHYLDEIDPDRIKIGMRLTASFANNRKGNILDIKYFRPVETFGVS